MSQLDEINDRLKRIELYLIGDKDLRVEGVAETLERHELFHKNLKKISYVFSGAIVTVSFIIGLIKLFIN